MLLRTGPFHEALRAAIDESGLTLERVRDRLAARGIRVSPASLSYWQQGRSRPERADSLRAVEAIESILGLPRLSLRALLGPPKPRGRWAGRPKEPALESVIGPMEVLGEAVAEVLSGDEGRARVVAVEDRVSLRADRSVRRVSTRVVLRACEDGADRMPALYSGEPETDPAGISVVAAENCRIGRVAKREDAPLLAAELLFDRPLRAGETYVMEYEFLIGPGPAANEYRRAFRYAIGTCLISVRFDPAALPVRLRELGRDTDRDPVRDNPMTLTHGRSTHLFGTDFGPGVHGISWEWE